MFNQLPDERLSHWSSFRKSLNKDKNPFSSTAKFWSLAPLIPHNNKIDPYNPRSWPTPWEIIYENRYDDFTLALMMGFTLKLTESFKNEQIEVRTMVDHPKKRLYNLLFVNETHVLNYSRGETVPMNDLRNDLFLENLIEVKFPR